MRTKEQILNDSLGAQRKDPTWDTAMSKHEHLTIEVLIDIRDIHCALFELIGFTFIDHSKES